jgi:hypothetical protein
MPVGDAESPSVSARGGEVGFIFGEPTEEVLCVTSMTFLQRDFAFGYFGLEEKKEKEKQEIQERAIPENVLPGCHRPRASFNAAHFVPFLDIGGPGHKALFAPTPSNRCYLEHLVFCVS